MPRKTVYNAESRCTSTKASILGSHAFLPGYEGCIATLRACVRINLVSETKMEYLSRGFKSVLGNQQAGSQASAHETVRLDAILSSINVVFRLCDLIFLICVPNQVERLCDRVASSTLLEDRRDAVRALKSLSKVIEGFSFSNYKERQI